MTLWPPFRLAGILGKRVKEKKLFQISMYPKRYHAVDFTNGILFIKLNFQKSDNDSSTKQIPFRNIISMQKPGVQEESYIMRNDCAQPYKYPMFLKTTERDYQLYANSLHDRSLWIAAFEYISK